MGLIPSYGVTAEYAVSLRDEQVRAVVREDRRDETAMKKRLLNSIGSLNELCKFLRATMRKS